MGGNCVLAQTDRRIVKRLFGVGKCPAPHDGGQP
jgi:hypothetical protein